MFNLAGSERNVPSASRLADGGIPATPIEVQVLVRPKEAFPTGAELGAWRRPPLSHDELAEKHGAAPEDLALVEKFAAANGLQIRESNPRSRIVRLSGTPAELAAAFQLDLGLYQSGSDTFLSHTGPVSLPDYLQDVVIWVFGLDRSRAVKKSVGTSLVDKSPSRVSSKNLAQLSTSPRTPLPAGGPVSVSYTAPELARLYDFPDLDGAGSGQCVGMIQLDGGYLPGDISAYFEALGIKPPQIVSLNENTSSSDPISNYQVTQNLEVTGAVVPSARLVVYNQNSASQTLIDYYTIFSAAIHDEVNHPSVLVNTWFFTENTHAVPSLGVEKGELVAFEALFASAALLGITICSASGSQGALCSVALVQGTYATLTSVPGTSLPAVGYPASSPWHLAVGGTTLYADNLGIQSEVVWSRLADWLAVGGFPSNGGATGGGVSGFWARPAYQGSAGVPEAITYSWNNGAFVAGVPFVGRGVPDVAGAADLFTGYDIYFDGAWGVGGGTGLTSPLWGALMALYNQALGARLGFVNPMLYDLQINHEAGAFRPIVSGGNGAFQASASAPWNACCGLGSPRGGRLLAAITEYLRASP